MSDKYEIGDWTACAIQEAYYSRLREIETEKLAVEEIERLLAKAKGKVTNLQEAVQILARDAAALGVPLS